MLLPQNSSSGKRLPAEAEGFELSFGESGLDQAEMRCLLSGRSPVSQFILFQGVLDTDAVQEEVSDDRPFPGTGRFALGHAILVVVKEGREV
jgi:hypothetical protein